MAKHQYRNTNFRPDSLAKIEKMDEIIAEYQEQGLRLTARQLYYQFVSRALIPNKDTEYKKLTALLTDARYAGMIDWDAIEDRGREPSTPSEWDNLTGLTNSALQSYRLPRWAGQDTRVELWVEKQALAGVLAPIAREFHATLMVNKGYSSASAMKESAERIMNKQDEEENGTTAVILYLGDHDPSGEDMVRDIDARLQEFGVEFLTVEKVALTIAQVRQYNPPPNPAKVTDPRARAYIEKFGDESWEVDALPPNVLTRLIRASFLKHIDVNKMDSVKLREELDKKRLRAAVAKLDG